MATIIQTTADEYQAIIDALKTEEVIRIIEHDDEP
jgi:hypothetical protein